MSKKTTLTELIDEIEQIAVPNGSVSEEQFSAIQQFQTHIIDLAKSLLPKERQYLEDGYQDGVNHGGQITLETIQSGKLQSDNFITSEQYFTDTYTTKED